MLFSNQIEGFALFIFGIDIYTNIHIHELAAHYLLNFAPSKNLLFLCFHALSLDIHILLILWCIEPERCKEEIVFGYDYVAPNRRGNCDHLGIKKISLALHRLIWGLILKQGHYEFVSLFLGFLLLTFMLNFFIIIKASAEYAL